MQEINLISGKAKTYIRIEKLRFVILTIGISVVIAMTTISGALFWMNIYMKGILTMQARNTKFQQLDPEFASFFTVNKEVEDMNKSLQTILVAQDRTVDIAKVFEQVMPLIPPEVFLKRFSLALPSKKVNMGGFAPTREIFSSVVDNLEKAPFVTSLVIPVESFVPAKNIDFTLSFQIK